MSGSPSYGMTPTPTVWEGVRIGYGAFGEVHEATVDGKYCVRKRLRLEDETAQQQFDIEADLMQQVHHANVASVVATTYHVSGHTRELFLEHGGTALIDMLIGNDPLPPLQNIMKQIVAAVAYLHRARIFHRDIKLENLVCTPEGVVKLVDFGLATQVEDPYELLQVPCGSKKYVAPEVRYGMYWGAEADSWSVGVCLFALHFGFFPFQEAVMSNPLFLKVHKQQAAAASSHGTTRFIVDAYAMAFPPPPPESLVAMDGFLCTRAKARLLVVTLAGSLGV